MTPRGSDRADIKHEDAIARMERANHRYNQVKMVLTVLTLLVLLAGFWWQNHESQRQRSLIVSCVVPEDPGTCYEENQKRTGQAVISIVEGVANDNDRQTAEIIERIKRLFHLEE